MNTNRNNGNTRTNSNNRYATVYAIMLRLSIKLTDTTDTQPLRTPHVLYTRTYKRGYGYGVKICRNVTGVTVVTVVPVKGDENERK